MATSARDYDAVVIGAGFGGLYMVQSLRALGLRVRAFEAADGVGGTWRWNGYPGARCDVEGRFYCYSFSDELAVEWQWSERYPSQAELRAYAEHVVERFDLARDIQLSTRVSALRWDARNAWWEVRLAGGELVTASYVVTAVGCLSASRVPDIPGRHEYAGRALHTGQWPDEPISFSGRDVAVIGTGSSGIQVITSLATEARTVTVLQRTPSYSVPARNRPLDRSRQTAGAFDALATRRAARREPSGIVHEGVDRRSVLDVPAEEQQAQLERFWQRGGADFLSAFRDLTVDVRANAVAADFVRSKIAAIVHDPETARRLTPTAFPIGAKRLCVDTGYFEAFNRPNVRLVDLRDEPIERMTEHGIRTTARQIEVDDIIFATGYDAVTGALNRIEIRGEDGVLLREAWSDGPRTYLGVGVSRFPNLFMVTGPGSPSILVNVIAAIEQHVEWISALIAEARAKGARTVVATAAAEGDWVRHVNDVATRTLFLRAASWYLGANVPGKPQVFMPYAGGLDRYTERCEEIASSGYEGFAFS